jgi:hypothetical protein
VLVYLLPVPGGPYNKIPFHGLRLPVNNCGNLIGNITASLSDSFADSRPATSSHLTFGFSITIAPVRKKIVTKELNKNKQLLIDKLMLQQINIVKKKTNSIL